MACARAQSWPPHSLLDPILALDSPLPFRPRRCGARSWLSFALNLPSPLFICLRSRAEPWSTDVDIRGVLPPTLWHSFLALIRFSISSSASYSPVFPSTDEIFFDVLTKYLTASHRGTLSCLSFALIWIPALRPVVPPYLDQ